MDEEVVSEVERSFTRALASFRGDGRRHGQGRSIEVKAVLKEGCARCEAALGASRALATVTAIAVPPPFPDRPNEGAIKVTTVFSGMGREDWDPALRKGGMEQAKFAAVLENALLDAKALDLEGLCIVSGKKVWSVFVDVSVISDGGNVIDVACVAAFGALRKYKRPDVAVIGEDMKIFDTEDREPVPLSIHHAPLCVTFALFDLETQMYGDREKYFLLDPTDREELVQDGSFTVIINEHEEICGMNKTGRPALNVLQIKDLVGIAAKRCKEMQAKINEN